MQFLPYARDGIHRPNSIFESKHRVVSGLGESAIQPAKAAKLHRARFSQRKPQSYMYATFAPVLHYNALQGDFVGGNFWDMRASGYRL